MPLKQIKRKLTSQSGASMLLAMVFLMFCLFVGGSVLAAATANAGRVESLKHNQQLYLSQRSAMQLMADLLKSTPESQLQLTIKDVTVTRTVPGENGGAETTASTRTVTFTIHGQDGVQKSAFQKLLYDFAVYKYQVKQGLQNSQLRFEHFDFAGVSYDEDNTKYTGFAKNTDSVTLQASLTVNSVAHEETLRAKYAITEDNDFQITFLMNTEDGEEENAVPAEEAGTEATEPPVEEIGHMNLTMNSYSSTGNTVTTVVDGVTTTTTTTVIRWDDPVISKGGA